MKDRKRFRDRSRAQLITDQIWKSNDRSVLKDGTYKAEVEGTVTG